MNIHVYGQRRAELERMIEEMIALLDVIDGDPDIEEGGDLEPSLGSVPKSIDGQLEYDLEADDCDDEDGGDTEPNGDELDLNGDEKDYSGYAGEFDYSGGR